MALDDADKAAILEMIKSSGGMSKDDVAEMINGMDKKQQKEFQKLQQGLDGIGAFSKAFEGIKPKKLAKAMARLGKKDKSGDGKQQQQQSGNDGKGQGSGEGKGQGEGHNPNFKDPYAGLKSKKLKKLEQRIEQVEREKAETEKKAEASDRLSTIKVHMAELPWVKQTAYDNVFAHYANKVERDPNTNKLVIKLPDGDYAEFTKDFVREDVQNQFDFALKPPDASGSGIHRGDGRKPGTISLDDDLSTKEASDAFAKALSKYMPAA